MASHTPDDGGSWTKDDVWGNANYDGVVFDRGMTGEGTRQVLGPETPSTTIAYYHSEDPADQDLDIYWDLACWNGYTWGAATTASIIFRAEDTLTYQDGYALHYNTYDPVQGPPPNYGLALNRYDNGIRTQIWTPSSEWWFDDDTINKFKITLRGSQITVYHWEDPGGGFDWVQLAQVTDATWAGGKILVRSGGVNGVQPDYLRVETAESPPDKPTIAITDQGADYIEFDSSAFGEGVPNYGHQASQWQVTLAADTGFATPARDVTTFNPLNFETYLATGLNLFLYQYIGRVRYQDAFDRWSEWSDASSSTAVEVEGQYYTAFAERPIDVNIRTDIPADWSELDTSDGESTWFLKPREDATCLVTMDRVSIDGVTGTVDPILWEGFPSIGQQIVFGRFVFDVITSEGTCTSGVEDATGLICRESTGLISGPEYGGAGSGGINPAGNTDPLWCGTSIGGPHCSQMNMMGPSSSGSPGATGWVQVAYKRLWPDQYWNVVYPVVHAGGVSSSQGHLCGLYKSWGWIHLDSPAWGAETVPAIALGSPPPTGWTHMKMGPTLEGRPQRWLAWSSHIGLQGEKRTGVRGSWNGGGGWIMFEDPCCFSCNGLESTHGAPSPCGINLSEHSRWCVDEWIVCSSNHVRILDLPTGWHFLIGGTGPHVSTGSTFWPAPVVGDGSDDQLLDFGGFAFPADTIYLSLPDGTVVEWDVPTGIWGGDVYRINSGILGAAGVGARLTGTFEGTDGTGYIAYIDANDGLKLDKWSAAGGLVNLDTVAFPVVTGVYYNVVLEAVGTTIRAKAWAGGAGLQGDPENNDPLTWAIELTDATYASGAPGLVGLTDQPVDFDAFAAGLGGDPYPTGRYPGACVWVSPAEGQIYDAGDSPLQLEWSPPPVTAGVLGGEIVYELQYQAAGDPAWASLATNVRGTTYSWDISSLPAGYYCVQVRAYAGCEYGPWAQVCFQWIGGVARSPEGYFFGDWYRGEAGVGNWIRLFQAHHTDDALPVHGCLVTRELMPAGVQGECLFQKLYVAVTSNTVGTLQITPILDGNYLLEERRIVQLGSFDPDDDPYDPVNLPPSTRVARRYEVDLTRGFGNPERFRYGYRGSYWQVEICATDYAGQGRIEIDGVAVKLTVVRESHPWARPFTGEMEVDVELERRRRFMFGISTEDALTASIYTAEMGGSDFGEVLQFQLEPNAHAPFGPSEEAWFRTLYLSFTRSNNADITLDVVPVLDGVALEATEVTLPAVVNNVPVTDIHEVPLSVAYEVAGVEIGRYGARGVWFSFRVTNSSQRSTGEIALNGAAVEVIPVRETEAGVV